MTCRNQALEGVQNKGGLWDDSENCPSAEPTSSNEMSLAHSEASGDDLAVKIIAGIIEEWFGGGPFEMVAAVDRSKATVIAREIVSAVRVSAS